MASNGASCIDKSEEVSSESGRRNCTIGVTSRNDSVELSSASEGMVQQTQPQMLRLLSNRNRFSCSLKGVETLPQVVVPKWQLVLGVEE